MIEPISTHDSGASSRRTTTTAGAAPQLALTAVPAAGVQLKRRSATARPTSAQSTLTSTTTHRRVSSFIRRVRSTRRPNFGVQNRITLVPDGVASVTVRLRHSRTVTVPVRNNVYRYTIHDSPAFMGTVWYDAQGRRIDHRQHP
jgi:hypothetical protein